MVDTNLGSLIAIKESYLHKNHQSSVHAITDMDGNVVERRYYDAFGDVKSYIGQASRQYSLGIAYNAVTDIGYTGHRTLVSAGVIHMGGRVYDAAIGRFLSADPHIQAPLNSQSLNRYSYTLNNPLSWTDPSGYFFKAIFKHLKNLFDKIKKIIKRVLKVVKKVLKTIAKVIKKIGQFIKKYARVIVAVVVAVVVTIYTAGAASSAGWGLVASAAAGGAAGGAVSGLILTGSLKGMLEGAAFGAIGGAIGAGILKTGIGANIAKGVNSVVSLSEKGLNALTSYINGGLTGGLVNKLQGGSFSKGFVNAIKFAAVMTGVVAVGRWAVNKVRSFGSSNSNAPDYDSPARDLRESGAGGEFEVNPDLGLDVRDGVLTGDLKFTCNSTLAGGCDTAESQFNRISKHDNVNIQVSQTNDNSLANFHVEIGDKVTTLSGARGEYIDGIIRLNTPYVTSTSLTPIHEFGHLLGIRGHVPYINPFYGVDAQQNSLMISGGFNNIDYPRLSNFTIYEVRRFIEVYSSGGR